MKNFAELRAKLDSRQGAARLGVVVAQDEHTLQAVSHAAAEGIITPVLYGRRDAIAALWADCGRGLPLPEIVPAESTDDCVRAALRDVKNGSLQCIMKGGLETGVLMKAVVNRETGIRRGGALSMIAMVQSPYYHKVFCCTDIGLMTYPDLQQKKAIVENAVELFHELGVRQPKVGVLAAVEKLNPKMPETVDAAALKEMNQNGGLSGCIVEGPISYDLCMDPEAVAIKGYASPVAGDPDILVVPNIVAGNILIKSLTCTGGAESCGTVRGAQVPIVICSRSSPAEDKYMSIVLAAVSGTEKEGANRA